MKKLFFMLAVAGLAANAYAADGKSTDFKFGGSMSQTFNWNDNTNFSAGTTAATPPWHESHWLQKNNFHVTAATSDKMMAYINFYNGMIWGASGSNAGSPYASSTTLSGGPNFGTTGVYNFANSINVTEAWMWWKASDMLSFKTGRQAVQMGSGFTVSKNEMSATPYFFDAVMGRMSWDFLDLDFGGSKFFDQGLTTIPATSSSNTDNEIVAYAVNAGIKALPDMFKKFDIYALAINGDQLAAASTALPGVTPFSTTTSANGAFNFMDIGAYIKMEFMMLDLGINYVTQTGKQKIGTSSATADMNYSGSAMDVELGVNLPEFMKARIYGEYHQSSGDDPTTTATNEGYQPLFYDVDKYAVGNIWGMSNLNNIKFGLSLSPSEETSFGVEYNMAARAVAKAGATPTTVSSMFGNTFITPAAASATEAGLGSVISVWGKHNYGHGLSMMAGLDLISTGNYYKPTTGAAPGSAMGLKLGAMYNF